MISKKDYSAIQSRLRSSLAERFKDVAVRVGDDIHYQGFNVVITSSSFAGLLPEQRFHHVVRALPQDLYDQLRSGVVWFELAPGEDPREYMKMPRSDDVVAEAPTLLKRLLTERFFKKLEAHIAAGRKGTSSLDFVATRHVLKDAGWSAGQVQRACLFFMGRGGFSDAQILTRVMEDLADEHADDDATHKAAGSKNPADAGPTGSRFTPPRGLEPRSPG